MSPAPRSFGTAPPNSDLPLSNKKEPPDPEAEGSLPGERLGDVTSRLRQISSQVPRAAESESLLCLNP